LKGYEGCVIIMGLQRLVYCNRVEGFINYALSNPYNISVGGIRCLCKRCKNKKIIWSSCSYDTSFTKRVHEKKIFVLVCIQRTLCSLRYHGKKDGWLAQFLVFWMC